MRAEKKRIDAWTAAGMSLSRNSNLAKKRARFMATANAPSAVFASFLRSSGPRLNALTTRAPRTVSSMTVVTSARRWRLSHEKPQSGFRMRKIGTMLSGIAMNTTNVSSGFCVMRKPATASRTSV